MSKYPFSDIEKRWQKYWEDNHTFRAVEDPSVPKEKRRFVMDMFPYPSAAGLHVGHPEGYTATDIYCRYLRMNGYAVLHPMGFDSFGLPAENYAIETGTHPKATTEANINRFREQIKSLGFSYDWEREVSTHKADYYRWTQWIFLQLYKRGLAYMAEVPVWYCEALGTVLANEEVIATAQGPRSERGNHPVERRPLRQWMLKITEYADRLLDGLDELDWPESIKAMQRNWIGRSEGANVKFPLAPESLQRVHAAQRAAASPSGAGGASAPGTVSAPGSAATSGDTNASGNIEVFTTRPDTLFGATYMVLAPEHPFVELITTDDRKDEVEAYIEQTRLKSDLERTDLAKDKTGVFTGGFAINPVNGEKIPVWISDYILISYGTGAIMAVPAHDDRDFEFAKKFELPIVEVVRDPTAGGNHSGAGNSAAVGGAAAAHHSGVGSSAAGAGNSAAAGGGAAAHHSGVGSSAAGAGNSAAAGGGAAGGNHSGAGNSAAVGGAAAAHHSGAARSTAAGASAGTGAPETAFTGDGVAVRSGQFTGLPTPEAKKKIIDWLEREGTGTRAVNYKLRDWIFSRQRYWGEPIPLVHCEDGSIVPVPESDLPVRLPEVESYRPTGTGESPLAAVEEWVACPCPDGSGSPGRRETNTMPQWAGSCWYYLRYLDPHNDKEVAARAKIDYWMPVDLYVGGAEHAVLHLLYARFWHKVLYDIGVVNTEEPFMRLINQGMILGEGGVKMSKSLGNVINPDDIIEEYGADSMRMYEMFMGPLESAKPWATNGLMGVHRFLDRVYRLSEREIVDTKPSDELLRLLHKTIKKVSEDTGHLELNTAIAQMMIFVNELFKEKKLPRSLWEPFVLILSPYAPHLGEELWSRLGHSGSVSKAKWPGYDEALTVDTQVTVVVQINGKVRSKFEAASGLPEETLKSLALDLDRTKELLQGQTVRKVIVVPDKLVNIVAG